MAELVDAPDSKSGHFGGVGFIYAKFTNINYSLNKFKKIKRYPHVALHFQKARVYVSFIVSFCIFAS